jgi:hypothetical protein
MKLRYSLLLAGAMVLAGQASAQEVVENWKIVSGTAEATSTGNTWLDSANRGRGVAFIAGSAASNTYGENAVAVISHDLTAPADIHILAADDGTNLGSFSVATTGDATLPLYRVAASDDGKIFVNGFEGTVRMYTDTTGASPSDIITRTEVASRVASGGVRGLAVTGDVSAGTAKIFLSRGANVIVYGNSVGNVGTFDFLGTFSAAPFTADISALAAPDENTVYAVVASSTAPNAAVNKWTVSYAPFTASSATTLNNLTAFVKTALAVNIDQSLIAIAEAGGGQDGFIIADINGSDIDNISPATGLDNDGDNVYDGGTTNLNTVNAVSVLDMDPVTGTVYGYSGTAADAPNDAAVFSLSVSTPSNVSDWMLF